MFHAAFLSLVARPRRQSIGEVMYRLDSSFGRPGAGAWVWSQMRDLHVAVHEWWWYLRVDGVGSGWRAGRGSGVCMAGMHQLHLTLAPAVCSRGACRPAPSIPGRSAADFGVRQPGPGESATAMPRRRRPPCLPALSRCPAGCAAAPCLASASWRSGLQLPFLLTTTLSPCPSCGQALQVMGMVRMSPEAWTGRLRQSWLKSLAKGYHTPRTKWDR